MPDPDHIFWRPATPVERQLARFGQSAERLSDAFWRLGYASSVAQECLADFDRVMADVARWWRFDALWGPMIGGAIMLGVLVLAALAGIYGGGR